MADGKLELLLPANSRGGERRIFLVHRQELRDKILVGSLWAHALLIEHRNDAQLGLDQSQHWRVVLELYAVPWDALVGVLLLHGLEHIQSELLLQLLICIVDAKLLEAVDGKGLKAKDVEQPNKVFDLASRRSRRHADAPNKPVENASVEFLGERITGRERVWSRERLHKLFVPCPNCSFRDGTLQRADAYLQRCSCLCSRAGRVWAHRRNVVLLRLASVGLKLNLSQQKHTRKGSQQALEDLTIDADERQCSHGLLELCRVRLAFDSVRLRRAHARVAHRVAAVRGATQEKCCACLGISRQHLVENMVVSLPCVLAHHARLFEEIRPAP
mmetsp:Transcript_18616/g.51270  ORF Transcript_18616/g.51270 Transcript_18616/m.51270 type:complete len:330 (+) Transcript_18616:664-1653(+)